MSAAIGWTRATVGEHWTHPAYPQAVVSSFWRSKPEGMQLRCGYAAFVNFSLVAECTTLDLAQHYVEAYLGAPQA